MQTTEEKILQIDYRNATLVGIRTGYVSEDHRLIIVEKNSNAVYLNIAETHEIQLSEFEAQMSELEERIDDMRKQKMHFSGSDRSEYDTIQATYAAMQSIKRNIHKPNLGLTKVS